MGGLWFFNGLLGVFLQADPLIGSPENLQNYNRYGYCFNNPLICTDPSGLDFWSDLKDGLVGGWHSIWRNPNLRMVAAVAVAVYAPEAVHYLFGFAENSLAAAAISGFASGAVGTGTLKGALLGAVTAGVFHGVGNVIHGGNFFANAASSGAQVVSSAEAVMLHGVAGCATSVVGGGKCGPGAMSAAFSEALSQGGVTSNPKVGKVEGTVISGRSQTPSATP